MEDIQRRLLTRAEVAQLLGVEPKTLANWRTRRYGPQGFRVGKAVRYWRDEVDRWLVKQEAAEGDGLDTGQRLPSRSIRRQGGDGSGSPRTGHLTSHTFRRTGLDESGAEPAP